MNKLGRNPFERSSNSPLRSGELLAVAEAKSVPARGADAPTGIKSILEWVLVGIPVAGLSLALGVVIKRLDAWESKRSNLTH